MHKRKEISDIFLRVYGVGIQRQKFWEFCRELLLARPQLAQESTIYI